MKWAFLPVLLVFFASACPANILCTAGVEGYAMNRTRVGGTYQSGPGVGVRVNVDRLSPCGIYLGGEFFWGEAHLSGNNSADAEIKSQINDMTYEGRIGFTLQTPAPDAPFFTPYIGLGHFRETNEFKPPSPLTVTFVDTFDYFLGGFLSGTNITPLLSIGVNFKALFMLNGTSTVENDPEFETLTLHMKKEIQARLEVPIVYTLSCVCEDFGVILSPFYEYRHFGGQEDFPFDFIDTKFHLIGAKLALYYEF